MSRGSLVFALAVSLFAGFALSAAPAAAKSHILREGDVVKVRLESSIGTGISAGDTIPVTIPEAWQRDPKGSPDIPAGTRGVITLKPLEKKPDQITYEVTSFTFRPEGKRVSVAARLGQDTPGVIKIHGASIIKKMFIPPLLGFLIWHGGGSVDAGTALNVEIAKRVDWQ